MTTKTEFDNATGEVVVRDMTTSEQEQFDKDLTNWAKFRADQAKANTAKATAKAALLDKLGITADEAALLLG